MATLTLTFKGKTVHTLSIETGIFHIGRDDSNTIQIDSLAVAPVHAAIITDGDGHHRLKQLSESHPLLVNDQATSQHLLAHGDRVRIGKHLLYYTQDQALHEQPQVQNDHEIKQLKGELAHAVKLAEANLQILNGKHIGRVIPLKGPLTRLGKSGSGTAVIARRKDGYFLSVLENEQRVTLNRQPIGDKSVRLDDGDTVEIDHTHMQFFMENERQDQAED